MHKIIMTLESPESATCTYLVDWCIPFILIAELRPESLCWTLLTVLFGLCIVGFVCNMISLIRLPSIDQSSLTVSGWVAGLFWKCTCIDLVMNDEVNVGNAGVDGGQMGLLQVEDA